MMTFTSKYIFSDFLETGLFIGDFRFLSESGIDCVKTDVQCRIDELASGADKARLAGPYQEAFRKSGNKSLVKTCFLC